MRTPTLTLVSLCIAISITQAQPNCAVDTVAPVFDTIYPAIVILECPDQIPPVVFPGGTDDCDTTVLESALTILPAPDPCDGLREVVTRTYFIQDLSGNVNQFVQEFFQVDNTPPMIVCPADIEYDCAGPAPMVPPPSATDNCTSEDSLVLTAISSISLNQFGLPVETYTYTVTDCKGNSASCSFTVTAVDNTPPVFDTIYPAVVFLECPDFIRPVAFPGGTDDCDTSVIQSALTIIPGPNPCDGLRDDTISRTYFIQDASGNVAQFEQSFIQIDTTPPEIFCPGDITFECGGPDPLIPPVTAMDNCTSVDSLTFTASSSIMLDSCGLTIEMYTYTVEDCRGNSASCSFTVTQVDTSPPMLTLPDDVTFDCAVGDAGVATATDVCEEGVAVEFSDVPSLDACGLGTISRTWTAMDCSGNSTQGVQLITIQDITPPSMTIPDDITFQCVLGDPGTPVGTSDDCDVNPVVTFEDLDELDEFGLGQITRTWTITDCSGNQFSQDQVITIVDGGAPFLTMPIDIKVFGCEIGELEDPVIIDNCGPGNLTITEEFIENLDECGEGEVIRIVTVTDGEGNSTEGRQVIRLTQYVRPTITCSPDITISCEEEIPVPTASGTAGCGEVDISMEMVDARVRCVTGQVYFVFTAIDCRGVTAVCTSTVTVVDEILPVLVVPPDMTFECEMGDPGFAEIYDNCEEISTTGRIMGELDSCGFGTIEIMYMVRSFCQDGDVEPQSQFLTITDTEPPMISVPADQTIACDEDLLWGDPTLSDNCGVVELGFEDSRDTTSANEIIHERRWQAVDCRGNTSVIIQTIVEVCASPIDDPTGTGDSIDTDTVIVDVPEVDVENEVDSSLWVLPEVVQSDRAQDVDFVMYPNPSSGVVYFRGEGLIDIYNTSGQYVEQVNLDQRTQVTLPAGVYVCHQNNTVKKLIVID